MVRENASLFAFLQRVVDASVVAFAYFAAFLLRFHPLGLARWDLVRPHPGPLPVQDYFLALPVVLLAFVTALHAFSLYEPRRTRAPLDEAFSTVKASLAAIVVLLALAELSRRYSRTFAAAFAVMAPALLASSRGVERALLRALRRRGWNTRRALVVGEGPLADELVKKLQATAWSGIELVGVLGLDPLPPPAKRGEGRGGGHDSNEVAPPPSLPPAARGGGESYRDVRAVARKLAVDQVLLAIPLERAPLLRELRELLDELPVDVAIVPDTASFLPIRPTVSELDGLPMVAIRRAPAVGPSAFVKRTLDVLVAALGLALLSPFLGLLALLIRILDGGPVLYRQERVGWAGRPFTMLKLRTMIADAESRTGPTRTTRGDPRVTPLGAFLRRTSLDELPQLWNVLKGDMSLVGPRPERPEFLDELRRELPDSMLRLTVKAGMTGLAQVRGFRGDSSLRDRLRSDLEYVRRWSLLLDLEILALTLVRGFVHENAF
ncbi:MAG TPA: exopolysaccharide biosynthesis polyprenyl glycosylphosphotransferase [Planctomycetota bacterium]|nr:exopolysaccharide biosynthesis polyprenyl glycosylphosphotransferase [Planctomycetota bacterium]